MDTNNFMLIFNLAIGVYALYAAIKGTGYAYKNDYPKAMKADADALMRKFLFIIGPVLLVSSGLEYFIRQSNKGAANIIALVGIVLALILIVTYIVMFRKRFGKYLKK